MTGPPLAAHLARALAEHLRWCRANAITPPPALVALADEMVSGGQARSPLDPLDSTPDAGPMLPLDYAETAARLRVSERTVRRLVSAGALPAVDVAGCRRVRVADLLAYVETLPAAGPGRERCR